MRVQDSSTSASCAKMTEEMSKNGGPEVNTGRKKGFGPGNANGSQSPSLSIPNDTESCKTVSGGRLKFYKDGKFILELSHRKDGERTSWVPVPKKTCWPLPSSASSTTMAVPGSTPRQESSASLSVSDDNSSVQSSPWQRDHGWKQGTPRQGISKEMSFIMQPLKRSGLLKKLRRSHPVRKRRRRPHSPSDVKAPDVSDVVGRASKVGHRPKLLDLVESLWKKFGGLSDGVARTSGASVTHNHVIKSESGGGVVASGKLDPSLVSPRKRILREMERVSLEDHATSKRHKSRSSALVECRKPPANASSNSTCQMQRLKPVDEVPSPPPPTKGADRLSNYSISSLLGKANEKGSGGEGEPSPVLRSLLRSPTRGGSNSQDCHSPSPISETAPQGLTVGRGGGKVPSPRHRHASPPAVPYHHPQHSLPHHHHVPLHSPRLPSPPMLSNPPSPPHSRGLSRPSMASLSSSSSPSSSPSSQHMPFLAPPALFPGGGLFSAPPSTLAPSAFLSPHHASSLAHPYYATAAGLPSGMRQPYRSTPSPVPSLWLHNYGMPSLPVARTGDAIASRSLYPGVMVGPCHSPMGVMPPWQSLVPHLQEDYKRDDGNSDAPLNLSKNAG